MTEAELQQHADKLVRITVNGKPDWATLFTRNGKFSLSPLSPNAFEPRDAFELTAEEIEAMCVTDGVVVSTITLTR